MNWSNRQKYLSTLNVVVLVVLLLFSTNIIQSQNDVFVDTTIEYVDFLEGKINDVIFPIFSFQHLTSGRSIDLGDNQTTPEILVRQIQIVKPGDDGVTHLFSQLLEEGTGLKARTPLQELEIVLYKHCLIAQKNDDYDGISTCDSKITLTFNDPGIRSFRYLNSLIPVPPGLQSEAHESQPDLPPIDGHFQQGIEELILTFSSYTTEKQANVGDIPNYALDRNRRDPPNLAERLPFAFFEIQIDGNSFSSSFLSNFTYIDYMISFDEGVNESDFTVNPYILTHFFVGFAPYAIGNDDFYNAFINHAELNFTMLLTYYDQQYDGEQFYNIFSPVFTRIEGRGYLDSFIHLYDKPISTDMIDYGDALEIIEIDFETLMFQYPS